MATCLYQRFYHILSSNATCKSMTILRSHPILKYTGRMLCTRAPSMKVKDCYLLLGVDWSATVVDVREAYLSLAKRYHPDCGRKTADAERFARIEQAYRVVMDHVTTASQEGAEVSDQDFEKEIVFDIHHTAPQHRQYLEYEGIGFGSPSKRQKQYQNYRVQRASDKVIEHKTQQFGEQETSIAEPEKRAIRRSKYSQVIDRLVEDLIQEAMSKGEFKNLSGSGKPLKLDHEQYVDSTTRRLNKVLINSGFAPEWIALDKEIRQDINRLRENLLGKRAKLGPSPLTLEATIKWEQNLKEFEEKLRIINQKIDKFNMIVPILNKQKVHVSFQKEVNRTVENYGYGSADDNDFQLSSCGEENKDERRSVTLMFIRKLLEKYRLKFLKGFTGEGGSTS
ncbi:dnaJ homolog subfamily C member 28-like [Oculina patagonica]